MPTRPTLLPVLLSPESAATSALGGPSATVVPPEPSGPAVDARGDNQSGVRVRD